MICGKLRRNTHYVSDRMAWLKRRDDPFELATKLKLISGLTLTSISSGSFSRFHAKFETMLAEATNLGAPEYTDAMKKTPNDCKVSHFGKDITATSINCMMWWAQDWRKRGVDKEGDNVTLVNSFWSPPCLFVFWNWRNNLRGKGGGWQRGW